MFRFGKRFGIQNSVQFWLWTIKFLKKSGFVCLKEVYRFKYRPCCRRDAFIASILDGVRASGNRDVCVKMTSTHRGHRLGPFTVPVDEDVESQHMKFLQQTPGTHIQHYIGWNFLVRERSSKRPLFSWMSCRACVRARVCLCRAQVRGRWYDLDQIIRRISPNKLHLSLVGFFDISHIMYLFPPKNSFKL